MKKLEEKYQKTKELDKQLILNMAKLVKYWQYTLIGLIVAYLALLTLFLFV